MRKAVFSGQFYPKTEDSLIKALSECFIGKLGPGAIPSAKPANPKSPLKAVIAPHAGYSYSGMAAAWAYNAISDAKMPDLFILLGPNHRSEESGISIDTFETPLGLVRPDQEFAKALVAKGTINVNEEIHAHEHSIEVQLPFLQFALGSRAECMKILPFLVSADLDLERAAKDIKETIAETKKKVTFIVSSDFTHYGRDYHYVPFSGPDVREKIMALDKGLLDKIMAGDYKGFEAEADRMVATVCGALPIGLMLRAVSFDKALLEQYYLSGDLNSDYQISVSYAAVVFK